ncbi:ABC-2 family transporter protein [Ruminococcaceae bacterium FB2012]|nr:ABC-2 family transporter protein [Ruminococcaceae bacterium FB2012]
MFRLTRLNFKNAIVTSETLFGLGLAIIGGIITGITVAGNGEKSFDISSAGLLQWVAGVFIAFALTIDNDSGAVRNRLIAGYSKLKILLAQVLSAMLLSLIYMFLSLIPIVIPCREFITKNKTVPQLLWGLLIIACGFMLAAVLAAVVSTVIFSRTGAIILVIGLMIGTNLASSMLFERTVYANSYYYDYNGEDNHFSERGTIPEPLRYTLKAVICSMPLIQEYIYDSVSDDKRNNRIEKLKEDIAFYEEHFGTDPKFTEMHPDILEIRHMRDELRIMEERETDYYFLPLYSFGMLIVLTAAGAFIYKLRNVE